jgi:hypothetical protein
MPLRAPPPSSIPILAAAGAGALVVALAAWWQLDGRARFDPGAQRADAAASASVAVVPVLPETIASASAPDAATTVAATPSVESGAPTSASMPTETSASTSPATAATASTASAPAASAGSEPTTASSAEPRAGAAAALEASAAAWLREQLPRVARAAERRLAPVLAAAARSPELRRRSEVRSAAQAARVAAASPSALAVDAHEAKSLNDAALSAYWRDNSVADALRLQTQALGANPLDPEIAGNLALLHLKEKPAQAEPARQLALHALTVKDERFPTGRIDDWTTLAIASALAGRDGDARNAWFVSMALTSDLQHQCNAAVRAQATYGERVRPSVQAMLQRARSSAAYGRCEVPQGATADRRAGKNVKSKSTQKARRAIP